jgi:hypothetical protein
VIEDVQGDQSGAQGVLVHGVELAKPAVRGVYRVRTFRPLRGTAITGRPAPPYHRVVFAKQSF